MTIIFDNYLFFLCNNSKNMSKLTNVISIINYILALNASYVIIYNIKQLKTTDYE